MNRVTGVQWSALRNASTLVVVAAALAVIAYGLLGASAAQAVEPSETKTADVVVQFDDHDVIIRPITFTGEISGLQALQLSGLEVVTLDSAFGAQICSIEGVGCPAEDCNCGGNTFWNYLYWSDGVWNGYMTGVSSSVISQTGAVEGYRWGEWGELPAPSPDVQAAQKGLDWLQARQSITNGGYSNNVSPSLDVMMAVAANHIEADAWKAAPGAPSLLDFVAGNGTTYAARGVAESGRLAVGVTAGGGAMPTDAVLPSSYYSDTIGSLSDQGGFLSWGILGSLAISDSTICDSGVYLMGLSQPNGGWEWSPGWGADTNSTALAIQALIASGVSISSTQVVDGLAYLKAAQNSDGGFPYQPDSPFGTDSDTNSTAWVVQAIMSADQNPRDAAWAMNGNTPIDFLLQRQLSSGAFEFQKDMGVDDEFSTRQAVQALLGAVQPMHRETVDLCQVQSVMLPWVAAGDE